MQSHLCFLAVAITALVGFSARAANSDCIKEGGSLECTDPILKSEQILLCSETGAYTWINVIENGCGFGTPTTSAGDAVQKINCFWDTANGCPGGTSTESPTWSSVGQTSNSYNCWNLTTYQRNGYLMNQWARMRRTTTRKDPNGACTIVGDFGFPYVAWLYRDVSCATGWNQWNLANGDVQCWRCPANSTWDGYDCNCAPGLVKDPHTKQCISGCANDSDCYQADYCAPQACINNRCTVQSRVCNDNLECTQDACDPSRNQCTNTLDPNRCVCQPKPVGIANPFSLSKSLGYTIACPGFLGGGEFGGKATGTGSGDATVARCDNGCTESASLNLDGEVKLALCKQVRTVNVGIKTSSETKKCIGCNPATCELACGDPACLTTSSSASASVGLSQFVGVGLGGRIPGTPWRVYGRCGGTLSGNVGMGAGTSSKATLKNCVACGGDCDQTDAKLTGGVSGQLGCEFGTLEVQDGLPKTKGSGGELVGFGTIQGTGTLTRQSGGCGDKYCASGVVNTEVGGRFKLKYKIGWVVVDAQVTASCKACREANSCGSCGCRNCDDSSCDWSMNVGRGK